jgi:tryptophanyl-tRNA synthetase
MSGAARIIKHNGFRLSASGFRSSAFADAVFPEAGSRGSRVSIEFSLGMTSPHLTSPSKSRKRVLSGMRPTGKLHLGNYVGALQNWVGMQEKYECFFCVVDWHALTTDYGDTSRVKENSLEVAFDWLAAGLDPEKSVLFLQSHVPAHAELHLLLSMITPLGWLERVPTYKEQRDNIKDKDLGTYGFLGYPVLQAADILIYRADVVPVGEDQVAHVELTREIARRFNGFYGGTREVASPVSSPGGLPMTSPGRSVFREPQALLTPAAKLPGTDGRKMSKSYGNTIMLTDREPVVRTKLKTMVTDPARVRRTDPGNPDVCPVGDLHKIFSDQSTMAKVNEGCRSAGIGCIECKGWAADAIVKLLNPMQERRKKYEENPRLAWDILEAGTERARKAAGETMDDVRAAMGMSLGYEGPK